jgi:hypothetical protein
VEIEVEDGTIEEDESHGAGGVVEAGVITVEGRAETVVVEGTSDTADVKRCGMQQESFKNLAS